MISRGCDTSVPFQSTFNCSLPVTTGTPNMVGFTQTSSYTCSDSLCNIFTQTEAQSKYGRKIPAICMLKNITLSTVPKSEDSFFVDPGGLTYRGERGSTLISPGSTINNFVNPPQIHILSIRGCKGELYSPTISVRSMGLKLMLRKLQS